MTSCGPCGAPPLAASAQQCPRQGCLAARDRVYRPVFVQCSRRRNDSGVFAVPTHASGKYYGHGRTRTGTVLCEHFVQCECHAIILWGALVLGKAPTVPGLAPAIKMLSIAIKVGRLNWSDKGGRVRKCFGAHLLNPRRMRWEQRPMLYVWRRS
jgi:hypothetical protein